LKSEYYSSYQKPKDPFFFRVFHTGNLSWRKTVEAGMWPDKVVKEDVCSNEAIGRFKRIKTSFRFVPCFKLTIKSLKYVVVD